jgi:hypothetical protein
MLIQVRKKREFPSMGRGRVKVEIMNGRAIANSAETGKAAKRLDAVKSCNAEIQEASHRWFFGRSPPMIQYPCKSS